MNESDGLAEQDVGSTPTSSSPIEFPAKRRETPLLNKNYFMTPTQLIFALVIVSGLFIILLAGGLEKKNKVKSPSPAPNPKAADPNIPSVVVESQPVELEVLADEEQKAERKIAAEENKPAKAPKKKDESPVQAEAKKPGRPKKSKGDDLILS